MRSSMGAGRLLVAGLLVVLGTSRAAMAADATGTWKWTVERNGNTIESTLKLKQEGEKLTGTLKRMDTESQIEDGKITGDNVAFKVTREFNGNKFVLNYQGKLEGDNIKGQIKFEREGETQSIDWNAKREK